MDIIRIPPAGGKTSLAKSLPFLYVDSDMLVQILGYDASKAGVEALKEAGGWDKELVETIVGERTLLTNFDPNWLNGTNEYDVQTVGYTPETYVEHIKLSGRNDLIEKFSEEDLRNWMNFDLDHTLAPGVFIGDVINLLD
jgi:hypothetical protein